MEGRSNERHRVRTIVGLACGSLLALMSTAAPVAAIEPTQLPGCATLAPEAPAAGYVVRPWRAVLDDEGVVAEHRLTLRLDGSDTTVRTDRRGFATPIARERILVGQRAAGGTTLTMLDTARGCRIWQTGLDQLAYDAVVMPGGAQLRLSAHEPLTRLHEGTLIIDLESGATDAMIEGECSTACEPNDGEVFPAAYAPAGAARPVPTFAAGGWAPSRTLTYRWRASNTPPDWARRPLKRAAADTSRTSRSRSPGFIYRSGATNSVRYTPAFPSFCRYGIACASRAMPSWAVWIRPHGTDFSWGTLGWCQKRDSRGCFDLRRVMLHELGHISGLNHPSSAGFTLAPHETVMHAISPAKPSAGSSRHAYGRCDVATLQELYDVPSRKTLISSCNDVATRLTLVASKTGISAGDSVVLDAQLKVAARTEYGLLRGNGLNGRSVRLKYRRAGSSDAWASAWMKPLAAAGRYRVTLSPRESWEFKAVFPAPPDEGLRFSRSSVITVRVK